MLHIVGDLRCVDRLHLLWLSPAQSLWTLNDSPLMANTKERNLLKHVLNMFILFYEYNSPLSIWYPQRHSLLEPIMEFNFGKCNPTISGYPLVVRQKLLNRFQMLAGGNRD